MDHGELERIDFRSLCEAIDDYEGASLLQDVLAPWLNETGVAARRWLQSFADKPANQVPVATDEELWDLYALSRANETLLLSLQPLAVGHTPRTWKLSLDRYVDFLRKIGLDVVRETRFSPFFHEIVSVEQAADSAAPITIIGEYWPAAMLGKLMVSRSGVAVRGGRQFVDKDIAENSRMYWAYRRNNRPTYDLSVGWGSNSQWRTCFRRDYRIGDSFLFNVEGKQDLSRRAPGADEDGLTPQAHLELLLNRCLITHPDPVDCCFPFDDTCRTAAAETA